MKKTKTEKKKLTKKQVVKGLLITAAVVNLIGVPVLTYELVREKRKNKLLMEELYDNCPVDETTEV